MAKSTIKPKSVGVARNRMRTEAGKMPESLIFLTENSPGVSNDRFRLKG